MYNLSSQYPHSQSILELFEEWCNNHDETVYNNILHIKHYPDTIEFYFESFVYREQYPFEHNDDRSQTYIIYTDKD